MGAAYIRTIPPALFTNIQSVPDQISVFPYYSDLQLTNTGINLLAVGWLERRSETNLYDTTKQDLISYSIAHDTVFQSKDEKVIIGGYSFTVPTNATSGQQFQIALLRPSATADGIGQDNYIEVPNDGSLSAGPINGLKVVTVGQISYVVGDAAPFRWFNAGDFGDGLLLNNDVMQVFQSAVYYLDQPPIGSDFFDAMDSSDGSTSGVFFGDDTAIDNITLGDGQLNVDDVYVTFRRSLDPSLTWYRRFWQNGQKQAEAVPNVARGSADLPGERWSARAADLAAMAFITGAPSVSFSLADTNVVSGQSVDVPVRAQVIGQYPLRVLMLNLTIEPLDGAPALTQAVDFTPAPGLDLPTITSSQAANNYAAVWLNSKTAGLAGDTVLGVLHIVLPDNANPNSAYRVHFGHASASPNGLALFPKKVQDGLLTFKDRSASSLGDGIPDSWRLRYFGTISNVLAQASADADGDGASNWAEFMSGTDPTQPDSNLRLAAKAKAPNANPLTLRWPSVANKTYILEAAPSVTSSNWSVIASGIVGTGRDIELSPGNLGSAAQFFRVRLSP